MKIKIKNLLIEADMADNFWKRMLGLSFSNRKNMLFHMPYEASWNFWMFFVRYSLKIIFIDSDKIVVDVKEAKPLSLKPETWKTYFPTKPCKYVLETPFALKIKVGDKLSW